MGLPERKIEKFELPKGKIKRYEYVAKHCGSWHDVCSVNKKNRTIRLYNEWGVFETFLDDIEELKTYEEQFGE